MTQFCSTLPHVFPLLLLSLLTDGVTHLLDVGAAPVTVEVDFRDLALSLGSYGALCSI